MSITVNQKYLKDEDGNAISPVVSKDSIYDDLGYNAFTPHFATFTYEADDTGLGSWSGPIPIYFDTLSEDNYSSKFIAIAGVSMSESIKLYKAGYYLFLVNICCYSNTSSGTYAKAGLGNEAGELYPLCSTSKYVSYTTNVDEYTMINFSFIWSVESDSSTGNYCALYLDTGSSSNYCTMYYADASTRVQILYLGN